MHEVRDMPGKKKREERGDMRPEITAMGGTKRFFMCKAEE